MNLTRLLRRHDGPTLRERLTATTARLQAVKGSRIALTPVTLQPEAGPVDRVALVNYATFLAWERERVCAELYPHLGMKAASFVLGLNVAERFFYPDGCQSEGGRAYRDVPPPSTRAVQVLDLVGVDWRQDRNDDTRQFSVAA